MSEFKGTKGNWRASQDEESICNENELIICKMHNGHLKNDWKANAKLIACAPEMLEMLERVEYWCSNVNEDAKIIKDIKQLIKKATS